MDRMAELLGLRFEREKFKGVIAEGAVEGRKILLLKPMCFMNRSGESIALAARNRVDEPGEVLILYDEVEIPLGSLRIRKTGSAGTHNGMKSVIERLGTRDVPRIRMGVGQERRGPDLSDYVLGTFHPDERDAAEDLVERAAQAAIRCIEAGLDRAMNEYNG